MLDAQLFLQSPLLSVNTLCFFHMLDAQLFLQSQLVSGNTLCFFHMLDAHIFLQSQLLSGNTLFFSHARCSTISSVSAPIWQHTLFFFHMLDAQLFLQSQIVSGKQSVFLTCSMLNYFFSLSSQLATHSVYFSHARCSTNSSVSVPVSQHNVLYHMLDAQMFTGTQCLTQSEAACESHCHSLSHSNT